MARIFNGSSQAWNTSTTLNLTGVTQLSVGFWLWWDAFANDDKLAFESSSNFNSNAGGILVDPDESGTSKFVIAVRNSAASDNSGASFARPSAAAWHHYLFIIDFATWTDASHGCIQVVYVDGVSQALTVTNNGGSAPSGFGNYTWYGMSRAASSLWGAGRMADLALWPGVLLNGEDAVLLAGGIAARLVRPEWLDYYWPMDGADGANEAPYGTPVAQVPTGGPTSVAGPPRVVRPYPVWYLNKYIPSGASPATISGSATGIGVGTGTLASSSVLSGTATAIGLATGTLASKAVLGGTATAIGFSTGTLQAQAALTGTATGIGSGTGTLVSTAVLVTSATGIGSGAGTLTSSSVLATSATGIGAGSGTVTAAAALSGGATGIGLGTGTLAASSVLIGTATGIGLATATVLAAGSPGSAVITGTAIGVGVATATLSASSPLVVSAAGLGSGTGTLAAASVVSGTATGIGVATGIGGGTVTIVASAAVAGTATGIGRALCVLTSEGGAVIVSGPPIVIPARVTTRLPVAAVVTTRLPIPAEVMI